MRRSSVAATVTLLRNYQGSTRRGLASPSPPILGDAAPSGAMVASAVAASFVLWASTVRLFESRQGVTFSKKELTLALLASGGAMQSSTTACSSSSNSDYYDMDTDFDSEEDRFRRARRFHRAQLDRYHKRWDPTEGDEDDDVETEQTTANSWPRRLPLPEEINALEFDFQFCQNNTEAKDQRYCDNVQFRIASYYLCRNHHHHHQPNNNEENGDSNHGETADMRQRGYNLLKDLADRGHADGMCLYGKILQEGRSWGVTEEVGGVEGIEANPNDAVVWWRRAVDMHRQHHLPTLYELGVALYTGEGVPEDTQRAIRYFRKAAEQGHAGAAYMLADGLLHGVGVSRDRAEALDWLVNAAEQGHREAQRRIYTVLETISKDEKKDEDEEELGKWDLNLKSGKSARTASIERRFTIGGGSRNPAVLARRKTVVDESRKG